MNLGHDALFTQIILEGIPLGTQHGEDMPHRIRAAHGQGDFPVFNLTQVARGYSLASAVHAVEVVQFHTQTGCLHLVHAAVFAFEDMHIYGAQDYNGYLTHLYGNWQQLPPKEKQITHHDFIELNLCKSFLSGDTGQ